MNMKTFLLISILFCDVSSNIIKAADADIETKTNIAALSKFKEYLKNMSKLWIDTISKSPLLRSIAPVFLTYKTKFKEIDFEKVEDEAESFSMLEKILKTNLLAGYAGELNLAIQHAQENGVSKETINSELDNLFSKLSKSTKMKIDTLFCCTLIETEIMKIAIQEGNKDPKLFIAAALLFEKFTGKILESKDFNVAFKVIEDINDVIRRILN